MRKQSESGLPGGGPSNRGIPLDPGIPGSKTFTKDQDAPSREFDKGKDESIYRTDNADDLLTDRQRTDTREDNSDKHDGIGYRGKGNWDSSSKTKWPYRDGLPHQHNASTPAAFVAERWAAEQSPVQRVKAGSRLKVALVADVIVEGLNPKMQERSKRCAVSLKRSDIPRLRWIMSVDCGNGPKVVKVKGLRSGNVTKLSKMDLDLKCSCQAWRWLGPEHHAKKNEYLDGTPRGTASVPVIKDPTGINRVCKHVAAVLTHMSGWDVARSKKKK